MSMKPKRLVICRPTKKFAPQRLLLAETLLLIDSFYAPVVSLAH